MVAAIDSKVAAYRAKLRDHLGDFADRYHVVSLALFGSRVRGEERDNSDLDVLVRFDVTPSLLTLLKLENELSDLLGVNVDLVIRESLRPSVEQRILTDLIPV